MTFPDGIWSGTDVTLAAVAAPAPNPARLARPSRSSAVAPVIRASTPAGVVVKEIDRLMPTTKREGGAAISAEPMKQTKIFGSNSIRNDEAGNEGGLTLLRGRPYGLPL